jgi:hypothetical protein
MTAFIASPPLCVLCAPGSPWSSRRRSCIERTRVASAAPWSSYCTARHYCCRSRPLRPPSLASGVSGYPGQASNRVGQRRCRRGSDVREDVGHCFVLRPTTQGPLLDLSSCLRRCASRARCSLSSRNLQCLHARMLYVSAYFGKCFLAQ